MEPLAFNWKSGKIHADVVPFITGDTESGAGSEDSESEVVQASSSKIPKVVDRTARYVIVELPGAILGRKRV